MEWMLMPLRRYAEFSGRSRRMEFWMWVLFQFVIGIVFFVAMMVVGGAAIMSGEPGQVMAGGGIIALLYILNLLLMLAFFIPNLAVTVRRLHDSNRSGWWILLFWGPYLMILFSLVMVGAGAVAASKGGAMAGGILYVLSALAFVVGSLVLLVFMFLEGTQGPNHYGPDPKGRMSSDVFA